MSRLVLVVCLSVVLWACPVLAGFEGSRYVSGEYGFRLILPEGWRTYESSGAGTLLTVGGAGPEESAVNLTVTSWPAEVSRIDSFLACEQLREIIHLEAKGYKYVCKEVKLAGAPARNIIFFRKVRREGREAEFQFVSQYVLDHRGRMLTLTLYVFGPSEEVAMDNFTRQGLSFLRVISGLALF